LAAAIVAGSYVLLVAVGAVVITDSTFSNVPGGGWKIIPPLVVGVIVVVALTLFVSCLLSTVATGISVLMAYGAGLIAGLLGAIGQNLGAHTLTQVANAVSWLLPFEAMYRNALSTLSPSGPLGQLVQLGPLGGAQSGGPGLWLYAAAYIVACGAAARWTFGRADL
jgi:hypothetical protein